MTLSRSFRSASIGIALSGAALLAACGGGDRRTVTVQSAPAAVASAAPVQSGAAPVEAASTKPPIMSGPAQMSVFAAQCGPLSFSAEMARYPAHASLAGKTAKQIVQALAHPYDTLSAAHAAKREEIAEMYRAAGFDLSLDPTTFFSNTLDGLRPASWSRTPSKPLSGTYPAPFSIDSHVYKAIPCDARRVELPARYFTWAQLHTVKGFDGVGYGVCIGASTDPVRTVRSQVDGKSYVSRVRAGWVAACQPENANADRAVQFIDDVDKTVVDCYRAEPLGNGDVQCNFARKVALGGLGDSGGTIASGNTTLAGLVRAGEATNATTPIRHAIFFNSDRMWRARVYPAVSGDAWIYRNESASWLNGLIPFGGLVQLDPTLDLGTLNLSLPARRILEAMQTYGAYLVNTGEPDFGIYTAANASEFDAYGGIYRPDTKNGVQDQIGRVLLEHKVYVVLPPIRR